MWINNAYAQFGGAGGDSGISSIVMMIGMFAVLWFIMIRPQMKRQKELKAMLESISKGDEVKTVSGMLGKVVEMSDPYVTVELAPNFQVKMEKAAIAAVLPKDTLKSI
ncbi:MAG: preprotein translocase subunit YajC [Betaproteobacteria bacterium]